MEFTIKTPKKEGLLTLDEDLTIQNAVEVRNMLLKAISSVSHTVIDMKNVVAVDVSFLQIVVAALHSVEASKKTIGVVNTAQGFRDVVDQSGFTHIVKSLLPEE
ncbi:MAG: STAS domain-containing protein [Nitrospirae bacterium]|nr:STAS domain-containing protein [Nitrospirota bacterium]MBF0591326.1 STAS domain-containing protein [Nitrospirota bacterium]